MVKIEQVVGIRVITLDEVDSTNEYAKSIVREVPEGTVVVAKRQTAGRGRKGRSWTSPEGGLWLSVILKPPKVDPRLVFVGALAVVDTLADFGIASGIKWPNDVWAGGKKIAGVLTEGKVGEYTILGVGLNVNNPIPEELRETATAMVNFTGVKLPLERVLERLLFHLDGWYRVLKERPEIMMAKVRERTFILGRVVRVVEDDDVLIGRAVDVLDDGSLLLDIGGQLRRVLYGDVSLRFF
ncbi:biotin--[acetyl-CoA-carboxylase] ligase [Thermococcus thioreducens]|uniref:Biotin--[acetyl-CoA-carboxylase] ligase n=1 Tax=Thermococcus thioreducens TaxID=277988 RepID=A0A1I0MDA6_9EURY|nr:biotin--[acetyl-CoA-carboxylase] ligase [Thermococcus thioreducens]ASJ12740.1 biotin--[acetyl-CoA-carboxylase] ligase [Thermococcus thioreducens]SEV85954.1 BirA family transcriptional regulator, biotin operon repressor / biotin-[acetyl-CoA-carboxylase] ligase [Thermococcus thioreducens]